jgi:hypothetical protein
MPHSFPSDSIYATDRLPPAIKAPLVSSASEINLNSSAPIEDVANEVPRSQSDLVHHIITSPSISSLPQPIAGTNQVKKKKSFWRLKKDKPKVEKPKGYGSDVDYRSNEVEKAPDHQRGDQFALPPLPFLSIVPSRYPFDEPVIVSQIAVKKQGLKELHPIVTDRSSKWPIEFLN